MYRNFQLLRADPKPENLFERDEIKAPCASVENFNYCEFQNCFVQVEGKRPAPRDTPSDADIPGSRKSETSVIDDKKEVKLVPAAETPVVMVVNFEEFNQSSQANFSFLNK